MAHYVILVNFTEQGVKTFKNAPERMRQRDQIIAKEGGKVHATYLTMGLYDAVFVAEFPDDAAAARALLTVAQGGNVRTTTLRAFTQEEGEAIAKALP
jgi:uncharacterized protein with GYD domain